MNEPMMTMISESTFQSHMRSSMEALEERLRRGERDVQIDIRELLHILSRMVSLERDAQRFQEMLYRTFKGYSDHYNHSVNNLVVPPIPKDKP